MHFRIAVDCIVLTFHQQTAQLKILLVRRTSEPQKGVWALPGGFVNQTEEFVETARAKLWQETGVKDVYLEQLKAYSLTDSSSQNRIASIVYYALINHEHFAPAARGKQESQWFSLQDLPPFPFDHGQKVADAVERIKVDLLFKAVLLHLFPAKFPLNQLQKFYEQLYQTKLDNRNFRKKVKNLPYLEALPEFEVNVSHRPGQLYRFDQEKFQQFSRSITLF